MKDVESLFHLSFTEMPMSEDGHVKSNKLVFVVSHKVKVFFRPESLKSEMYTIGKDLYFKIKNKQVQVINNSDHFASIKSAYLLSDNDDVFLSELKSVPPKSTVYWSYLKEMDVMQFDRIKLLIVNDYGVAEEVIKRLKR